MCEEHRPNRGWPTPPPAVGVDFWKIVDEVDGRRKAHIENTAGMEEGFDRRLQRLEDLEIPIKELGKSKQSKPKTQSPK